MVFCEVLLLSQPYRTTNFCCSWYCEVPNGTLRAYTFLKSKVSVPFIFADLASVLTSILVTI